MSSYGLGLLVILFFFGLAGGLVGRIEGQLVHDVVPDLLLRPVHRAADGGLYRYDNEELRRECPRCHRS